MPDKFDYTIEIPVQVEIHYRPERPPPPCSDHDSPAFSDCGDSGEFEVLDFYTPDGQKIPWAVVQVLRQLCPKLDKEIEEALSEEVAEYFDPPDDPRED